VVGWWNKLLGRRESSHSPQPMSRNRYFPYIKFEARDDRSLDRLTATVEAFKRDKIGEARRPIDGWAASFTSDELSTFWSPDELEMESWNKYWFSTPLPKRHSPEMPLPPWQFESMLEAILENGEYDLIGVRRVNQREAVLEFDPHAYPYGGALRALVRAFGHRIIGVDDGTGYELGDPISPRWTPEMKVEP
jgi:hypothetical protein